MSYTEIDILDATSWMQHEELARLRHGSGQQKEQYADKLRISLKQCEEPPALVRDHDFICS